MYTIETVKVKSNKGRVPYRIINKINFDPKVHELYKDGPAKEELSDAEKAAAEAKKAEEKAAKDAAKKAAAEKAAADKKAAAEAKKKKGQ